MEVLVPNLRTKMIPGWNDRLGRTSNIDSQKSRDAVENSKESIRGVSIKSSRLFNLLPVNIRNLAGGPLDFKKKKESSLQGVPDQSVCTTYNSYRPSA